MATSAVTNPSRSARRARAADEATAWPRDYRRVLQLVLAAIWLIDGVLQLQPFMFTAGDSGFSGMIAGTAVGNPHWVAHSITWSASIVDHHAILTNSVFAAVQIAIGIGIAWRPLLRPALAVSIVWSLGVWWFGEGLGGILHGAATPFFGGPGAVLFYALLAVLLWPADRAGHSAPFVAARSVGTLAAKVVWVVVWIGLALLAVVGSGRSSAFLSSGIQTINSGQPHWLGVADTHVTHYFASHGAGTAVALAVVCVLIAAAVLLPAAFLRVGVAAAIVVALVIWVLTQNFGMILAGGATDPNSGPLIVVLALAYWPLRRTEPSPPTAAKMETES